jgi:Replication-relaxation
MGTRIFHPTGENNHAAHGNAWRCIRVHRAPWQPFLVLLFEHKLKPMPTDTLARRIRFDSPCPQVARLNLTDADYLLFEAIARHGPLSTTYLYAFSRHVRKDYSHLQNRLTEFYNGDAQGPYLTRPPQQFSSFHARYQHMVYDLAPRARQMLAERGTLPLHIPKRTDPFLHQLMQACVGASLALEAPGHDIRYIPRDEILRHPKLGAAKSAKNPMALPLMGSDNATLIPDDLFGFEYPGVGFRFFAVEIDRNTESIERTNLAYNSIGKKVAHYLEVLHGKTYRTWWGIPNLTVLIITTNATHGRNILNYIQRQGDAKFEGRFALTTTPDFGANWRVPKDILTHLLREPWATTTGQKSIDQA